MMLNHAPTRQAALTRLPARLFHSAARVLILLALISLAGCVSAAAPQPTAQPTEPPAATPTTAPTAPTAPTATATLAPTATTAPTATEQPTATPIPPLAVIDDGFNAWCAPIDYAGVKPEGPQAPDYARVLVKGQQRLQAPIPAIFCALSYTFNQPVPDGVKLKLLDAGYAFIEKPLVAADGQDTVGWTAVDHAYVINPPFWEVTYQLVVTGPDGAELWSKPVVFAKPLPEPCLFGGLPDPVTLYCTPTDPWEIEPWPDVVYPYDRSRLTPSP